MEPVRFPDLASELAIKQYLHYELTRALSARQPLERQWRAWEEQYRAPAQQATKEFPFLGAPLARDTEILTKTGWRRIDAIRVGEVVLTRKDTGELEWHPVQAIPQRYADKLYHFKSRAMDLMVTEEHVMVAEQQNHPNVVRRIPARDLWNKTGFYLPQHGTYAQGKQPKALWGRDPHAIAEFIGWYLAEGSAHRNTAGNRVYSALSIAQSETANPEKCRRIEAVLDRCGFTWRYSNHAYTVHKSSIPTTLFEMLAGSGVCDTKRLPNVCWEWSAALLESVLTGMALGDGTFSPDSPLMTYFTTSKGLADDVQVMACLIGLHARVTSRVRVASGGMIGERKIEGRRRSYEVAVCAAPRAKYDRAFHEVVPYDDIAFCVTVENHAIYARRNGKSCWTGNSNYVLPITATDVDQLYAKFMQSLHASPDLWIVQAMNESWQDAAKPLQDFLSTLDRSVLKMWRVNKRAILEMCKMGTAIYEHGWSFEQRPISTYDDDGKVVRMNRIRSQPFVDHVRLTDFLIPPYAYAIQPDDQGGAPWVAKRVEVTREKLLAICTATDPFLPDIGRQKALDIIAFERRFQQPYDDTIQKLDYDHLAAKATENFDTNTLADGTTPGGVSGGYVRKIELWEFHVRWAMSGSAAPGFIPDQQGSGSADSPSDLVILWHDPTQTIVRAIYQPYLHGYRPFEAVRFFPGPGFYGIGMCEQLEVFQGMESELHNWLYDNVLLGNSTMLAAQAGSNIAPGEPIYPSKVFITEGPPQQSIMPLQMGSGHYPGLDSLIEGVENRKNQRSGISDLQQGNIGGLPGRTPATSVQALLAEGNRRPDLTLKDMRYEGLSTIGLRLIQLCQQFAGSKVDLGGKRYLQMAMETLGLHQGAAAVEKLQTPLENAELGLGVEIAAASATQNKDMLRQQYTGLLTLVGQLYPQMIQMAQAAQQGAGTPMGEIAQTANRGMSELLTRVLEQYDIRDTERMVPELAAPTPQAAPVQGAAGPQPGPAGNAVAPLAPPGMGALPPGYGNAPPGAG